MSDVESIERPEGWRNDPAFNILQNNNHPELRYHSNRINADGYLDRGQDNLDEEEQLYRFPPYREGYPPHRNFVDRYGQNVHNRNYHYSDHLDRYPNRYTSGTYPPFREERYSHSDNKFKDYYEYRMNDLRIQNMHPSERYQQNRELFDRYNRSSNPHDRYQQSREPRIPSDARYTPYPKNFQR